jgi:hypothetical protein
MRCAFLSNYFQVPAKAFEQQLAHGKEAALALFDKHKHHLTTACADNARKELTKKLVVQDAQHRSRYRVVWVRFSVSTIVAGGLWNVPCLSCVVCVLALTWCFV